MKQNSIDPADVEKAKKLADYWKLGIWAVAFILVGAVFYHIVEKLTWLDSFYFTVITLATVGYGDIVPTTPAGKLFTIFYVLVGISLFIFLGRIVISGISVRVYDRREQRRNESDPNEH